MSDLIVDRRTALLGISALAASSAPPAYSAFGNSLGAVLVQDYVRAINSRNYGLFDRTLSPDYADHSHTRGNGRAGTVAFFRAYLQRVPDLTVEIADLVADDRNVAARLIYRGSNADGVHIETSSVDFWRIRGTMLGDHWDGTQPS